MSKYREFRCPRKSRKDISIISESFRNEYWKDKSLPIDMELLISQKLRLEVIPTSFIKVLEKTDAYLTRDLSAIIVDLHQYMDEGNRWANRLRFAMAHEVGHFILHRNVYENLKIDADDEYIEFVQNAPEDEYNTFEWQANEFAGSLLVPRERLKKEIQLVVNDIIHLNKAHLLTQYANDILARISYRLARPFGVSTQVIERRVNIERLWPPNEDTIS